MGSPTRVRVSYTPRVFRLTREVRFAVNRGHADVHGGKGNSYAGMPPVLGLGQYLAIQVTLEGEPDPRVQYVTNIKSIDAAVRERAVELVRRHVEQDASHAAEPARLVAALCEVLRHGWDGPTLYGLALRLSPFLSYSALIRELPMVRLSQKFEFSASHRLHSPRLSDEQNRSVYGKCNNPHGHGHNYEVQVTLRGEPDPRGVLIDIPAFERIVGQTVIDRFDHKHLNLETAEFRDVIPSVENIAKVIYHLLKPEFEKERARLASVTVWETPKTWSEYGEEW